MKSTVLAACILACAPPAQAQDRVIGLLALPDVFGNGPCQPFTPQDVPLYATPESITRVGTISVQKYWTFHANGGCDGLEVRVRMVGAAALQRMPAEEHGYEEPAAIVLTQRGQWFEVRLTKGAAWVRSTPRDTFYSLERLFVDGLTYLTTKWDGRLAPSPGKPGRAARTTPSESETPVRVIRSSRVRGQQWFYVEVMSHSCGSASDPTIVDRGWVPSHAKGGATSIWFHSRGC
jgi:hypothetical protein